MTLFSVWVWSIYVEIFATLNVCTILFFTFILRVSNCLQIFHVGVLYFLSHCLCFDLRIDWQYGLFSLFCETHGCLFLMSPLYMCFCHSECTSYRWCRFFFLKVILCVYENSFPVSVCALSSTLCFLDNNIVVSFCALWVVNGLSFSVLYEWSCAVYCLLISAILLFAVLVSDRLLCIDSCVVFAILLWCCGYLCDATLLLSFLSCVVVFWCCFLNFVVSCDDCLNVDWWVSIMSLLVTAPWSCLLVTN